MGLWPVLMGFVVAPAAANPGVLTESFPEYRVEVQVDLRAHTVTGTLRVRLLPGDPRILPEWRFHLPPNRFRAVDPRGRRRDLDSYPFERQVNAEDLDPLLPEGFSPSGVDILSARDERGTLNTILEANPLVPLGYSADDALLRVSAPDGRPLEAVTIQFRTRLPHRYMDGWSESGLFLESWHPTLATWREQGWDLDPNEPSPAHFKGTIDVDGAGWLVVGPGLMVQAVSGARLDLGDDLLPAHSLPIVFLTSAEPRFFKAGRGRGVSFSFPGGERIDRVSRAIAERFCDYLKDTYELGTPEVRPDVPGNLVLVQWDLPTGDMRTLGHIVLIPKVHRHDDPLLDRLYTAKLARAIARVWFGETVWANEDLQAWLPLGISGYLALEFFESLWGWDGRIHTITDWLNPRYREHFLESPVRDIIFGDQDAPLLISLTGYPYRRTAVVVAHYKSVLVLRTLSFVAGQRAFRRSLTELYRESANRVATQADFARIISQESGQSLEWFFSDWFEGTPRLDYEIVSWGEVPIENGHLVQVLLKRTGVRRMPIEVEATDVLGDKALARYDGESEIGTIYLSLPAEPVSIRLDPKEFLIELDRRNNLTSPAVRFRPFYDWAKQSDVLVTLQGRIGGNAIDGNYAGLGVAVPINETNTVQAIPIYGERTQWNNYELSWSRSRFLLPRMDLGVSIEKLGGTAHQTANLGYSFLTPDWLHAESTAVARLEQVEPLSRITGDRIVVQDSGPANNLGLGSGISFSWSDAFKTAVDAGVEHSEPAYTSDFIYTRWNASISQSLRFNPNHEISLSLIRDGTEGQAPIQKEILIGGPNLLRGYPRTLDLVFEQAAGVRLNYQAALARGIWGGAIQVRKVSMFLFGDVAKGWDNNQTPDQMPQRQDVGIGIELRVNVISFVEFPVRMDIAFPVNDSQYRAPQVILFEALAFF